MMNAMEGNMRPQNKKAVYIKRFKWFCVVAGGRKRYY
jgi:hypothetical protein